MPISEQTFTKAMTDNLSTLMSQLKRSFIYTFLTACLLFSVNSVAAEENLLTQQLERIKQQTGVGAVAYALVENNKIVATGGIGTYGNNNVRISIPSCGSIHMDRIRSSLER